MNEVERAIEYLEPISKHPTMTGAYCEHLKTAIIALREQAERNRGCCYCNTGEPLNGYEDVGSFIILPKGKKYYLEIAFSNDFYSCATDINFCPNCGKRLEVEP